MHRGFIISLMLSTAFSSAAELWSLRPLKQSTKHHSIDGFIREAWTARGIGGSPQADARTLIRRAAFDLTGLPPSPEEVDAFVADAARQPEVAYRDLIERLLASPHYGEQWARHWLDVARYSDTKGYVYAREEKNWVHAPAYRDWVVRALNDDMPYDRFLLLQIAADQVVPSHSPDLAAMGFLTIGRRFLGVTHDIIDDRIDVVMRGTQALTVGCARCHDHKYDPISTRDYYSLYGVFQSCAEALVPCDSNAEPKPLAEKQQKLRETMRKRREEQMVRTRSTVRKHLEAQLDLDKYPEEVFGIILDEKDLNPFIVRRWQNFLAKDGSLQTPLFPDWHKFAAQNDTAALRGCAKRYAEELAAIDKKWSAFRTAHPGANSLPDVHEEAMRRVLYGEGSPCHVPDEHIANNEMYFPTNVVVELWKLQGEVDRWLLQNNTAPAFATVLQDRPVASTPRVFIRGNPLNKGDEVPRQFLTALSGGQPKPFTHGSGRLDIARAIIDPQNPLTARVMVNRLWQHHFGRGFVSTPSDFGTRATPPSHPGLLDWLASELICSGWSLKHVHRLIMTSGTYRQCSRNGDLQSPTAVENRRSLEADPDNTLLWRMNAHRLSFEESRDAWLATAGRLNLRIGGRPESIFGGGNIRRTLYSLIDRENLPAVMRTFDFANPDLSIPQRAETTVPQQALFGMNHPFVVQQAKAIAKSSAQSSNSEAGRVEHIYRRLFQRSPSAHELQSALAFVGSDEVPAIVESDHAKSWSYGFGEWDDASGRVKSFTPLPHFTGHAWQGAEDWPDQTLGWAQLTADGGHPGNDRRHAVVRRWIAPADGFFDIRSALVHEPKAGDGIRGFVSHSRLGKLQSTKLLGAKADLNLTAISFRCGDTLDFIVDIGDGLNSDQFLWSPVITTSMSPTGGAGDQPSEAWDAKRDFGEQPRSSLNAWEQLTQALMLSNEFMFVD